MYLKEDPLIWTVDDLPKDVHGNTSIGYHTLHDTTTGNAIWGGIDRLTGERVVEEDNEQQTKLNNTEEPKARGDKIMTASTGAQRKVITVTLMDQDSNISNELAVVATFPNVVCQGNQQATLMQLVADKDINFILREHNARRGKLIDKAIRQRTGNEVHLEDITLQDLEIQIS